jgi:integrase
MNIVNAASKDEIDLIYSQLKRSYSNEIYADIWKIGLNLSLRISDLLSLKFDDFNIPQKLLYIKESKTGKSKEIRLNSTAIEIINSRRSKYPNDIYLFQVNSNRAKNKPISRISVSRVFKECADLLKIPNINTHSLRKSRGKAMFDAGKPIEMIAKVLNHSSPATTMTYLGITKDQVMQTYDDFEL